MECIIKFFFAYIIHKQDETLKASLITKFDFMFGLTNMEKIIVDTIKSDYINF